MTFVTVKQLMRCASLRENVLMCGLSGVGKTTLIIETFTKLYGEMNVDWMMFNGGTVDPWLNFIGIPKTVINARGEEVTRIIPPESFPSTVRAIFFDEINRAPDSVQNGLMELIHTKSINGRKFDNLEVVWGAINPAEDRYKVVALDPAMIDRFQVHLTFPYVIDEPYFKGKFGDKIGKAACDWWNSSLDDEQRRLVSPRRVDYAMTGFLNGQPLSNYLPDSVDSAKLGVDIKKQSESEMFLLMVRGFSPVEIAAHFTEGEIRSKAKFFEENIDVFKKSIIPHLSDETVGAIVAKPAGIPKLYRAISDAGRVKVVESALPALKNGFKIEGIINTLARLPEKSPRGSTEKRRSAEPYLDVLADAYPLEAAEAFKDNDIFTKMTFTHATGNRVEQIMNSWESMTRKFPDVRSKAIYLLLFTRHNRSATQGIGSIFTSFNRMETPDFKTFLSGRAKSEAREQFILEIAAVAVMITVLVQQYHLGEIISPTKKSDGFFKNGALSAVIQAGQKILRSASLKAVIRNVVSEKVMEELRLAFSLSTGAKKNNLDIANRLMQSIQNDIDKVYPAADSANSAEFAPATSLALRSA
jgi:hypothetical protein